MLSALIKWDVKSCKTRESQPIIMNNIAPIAILRLVIGLVQYRARDLDVRARLVDKVPQARYRQLAN